MLNNLFQSILVEETVNTFSIGTFLRAWQHRWYLESWLQGFICFGIHIPKDLW